MAPLDEGLLGMLEDAGARAAFWLRLGEESYPLGNVAAGRAPTPVSRPATRGGAYFSERSAYRIAGTVGDRRIVPRLSGMMLGPSAEFADIEIRAQLERAGGPVLLRLHANLTGSVEGPSGVELRMILVGIERA